MRKINEHGYQIKSYWDGDQSVCHFMPKPYHISVPGYVDGGLLASLIDCHGTGTAAAALFNAVKGTRPQCRAEYAYAHRISACGLSETDSIECGIGSPRQSQRAKGTQSHHRRVDHGKRDDHRRGELVAVQVPEFMLDELLKEE